MKTPLLLVLLICTTHALWSQTKQVSLEGTQSIDLTSSSNGETYQLQVALPFGYSSSQTRYKTLYVLDANVSFGMVRDIQTLISFEPQNEPLIVVGIAYTNFNEWISKRGRDYIPGQGSGAEQFHDFLETQVIPKIGQLYRTSEQRILYGHSSGGVFGFLSLLKSPDLFSGYILTSPSVDEDREYTLKALTDWQPTTRGSTRLFISIGKEEKASFQTAYSQLEQRLKQISSDGFSFHSVHVDGTHMSSMPQALIQGLQFVNQ